MCVVLCVCAFVFVPQFLYMYLPVSGNQFFDLFYRRALFLFSLSVPASVCSVLCALYSVFLSPEFI